MKTVMKKKICSLPSCYFVTKMYIKIWNAYTKRYQQSQTTRNYTGINIYQTAAWDCCYLYVGISIPFCGCVCLVKVLYTQAFPRRCRSSSYQACSHFHLSVSLILEFVANVFTWLFFFVWINSISVNKISFPFFFPL